MNVDILKDNGKFKADPDSAKIKKEEQVTWINKSGEAVTVSFRGTPLGSPFGSKDTFPLDATGSGATQPSGKPTVPPDSTKKYHYNITAGSGQQADPEVVVEN